MIDLEDGLVEEFLAECAERLATVEADLLAIEKGGGSESERLVNRIFQAVHSVGVAGIFGLDGIRDLAHEMEVVLAPVRCGDVKITPERASVLLRAADRLLELIQAPGASNQADTAEIMAELTSLEEEPSTMSPVPQEERQLQVLLVEDDFASRLLLQTFLSRYGECHVAVNGVEAVEACQAAMDKGRYYDLVCMDIMMPEMDGRQAVRQIRAIEEARGILPTHGAKIVMTTAVREFREVIRCFQDLCDAYLMKPINLAKLLRQMRTWQLIQ